MNYHISDRMASLQPSAIREILKATSDPSIIPFAAGNPAAEAFPAKEIAAISAEILEKEPITALQYSITEGYPLLRESIKDFACRHENLFHGDDALITCSGAQQGIELTTKCLCNEGDTVICEDPSFIGSLNTFRSYKTNLVGIPMEEDGMNLELLEKALKENPSTRFIYVIPNFQNPSGYTTSLEKRQAIYALAKQYGVMIMEDNPYGELRYSGESVPSIKRMDEEGIVVYCGSFSKIISPGMRIGYVIAPQPLLAKIIVAKQASDVHSNIWAQMVCDRFLRSTDMDAHIAKLNDIYRRKVSLMTSCMEEHFSKSVRFTRPEGGLFLWCDLPEQVDMMGFCNQAVQNKVAVVPGIAFAVQPGSHTHSIRLNFSTPSDEGIVRGIEILGKMTQEF